MGGPVPNLRSPVLGAVSTRGNALWGGSTTPQIGTRPSLGTKPAFRTDVACQSNPIPDLNGPLAAQAARPRSVSMRRALRTHLRDVVAIAALVAAALFAVTVILINQRAVLPSWVR